MTDQEIRELVDAAERWADGLSGSARSPYDLAAMAARLGRELLRERAAARAASNFIDEALNPVAPW